MTTNYFWQGGRKVAVEESESDITIHADRSVEAEEAASRAGVALETAEEVAPGLVRATVSGDRDNAMQRLRQADQIVHHVYRAPGQPDAEYLITDGFFVKFKPGTPARNIQQYLRDENLELVRDLGNNTLLTRVTTATGRNAIKTANTAARRDDVEYAEPNLVRRLQRFAFIPADTLFAKQWHLHAPVDGPELLAGAGIFAPDAWDLTRGVRDVVICVADDGFDLTHPDFQGMGKVAGRLNARSQNGAVVFDSDVQPRAGDYHGTPCAGVALAESNGQGVVGVAPGCAFLPVRFPLAFDDDEMIQLFERISRDADVVSCSWGFGPGNFPMSRAFFDAIARLARTGGRRGKGLVICVAAGNNNAPVKDLDNTSRYEFLDQFGFVRSYSGPIDRWIAAHPDVITVSGCTSLKTRSCYSSWGKDICVCAPTDNWDDMRRFQPSGRGITTTDNEGFGAGSDFTSNSRFTSDFGGTSSATPTVAGVCGLVLSRNPALTAQEVKRLLQQNADKDVKIESETDVNEPGDFVNGFSLWYGHGKVNAAKAVRAAGGGTQASIVAEEVDAQLEIPDVGSPVSSFLDMDDDGVISEVRVGVDITHTYIGDLRVDLIAPDGTAVTLHNHTGGSRNNLRTVYGVSELPALRALAGKRLRGRWELRVVDTWAMDVGRLNSWRLIARVTAAPAPAAHPQRDGRRARRAQAAAAGL